MNEVLLDQRTLAAPLTLPRQLLKLLRQHLAPAAADSSGGGASGSAAAPEAATEESITSMVTGSGSGSGGGHSVRLCQLYLGSSVGSICSGMTAGELQGFFGAGCMCIRSYNPATGAVSLKLPGYLAPPPAAPAAAAKRRLLMIEG